MSHHEPTYQNVAVNLSSIDGLGNPGLPLPIAVTHLTPTRTGCTRRHWRCGHDAGEMGMDPKHHPWPVGRK